MSLDDTLERIALSIEGIQIAVEKIAARHGDQILKVEEAPEPKPEKKAAGTSTKKGNDTDVPSKDDVRAVLVELAEQTESNDAPRDALKEFGVKTVPQLKESQHADIIRHVEGLLASD